MSRQNIYDDDVFFEYFRNNRSNPVNFNDCIETPILFSMLPDLRGKAILDIGCGSRVITERVRAGITGADSGKRSIRGY